VKQHSIQAHKSSSPEAESSTKQEGPAGSAATPPLPVSRLSKNDSPSDPRIPSAEPRESFLLVKNETVYGSKGSIVRIKTSLVDRQGSVRASSGPIRLSKHTFRESKPVDPHAKTRPSAFGGLTSGSESSGFRPKAFISKTESSGFEFGWKTFEAELGDWNLEMGASRVELGAPPAGSTGSGSRNQGLANGMAGFGSRMDSCRVGT